LKKQRKKKLKTKINMLRRRGQETLELTPFLQRLQDLTRQFLLRLSIGCTFTVGVVGAHSKTGLDHLVKPLSQVDFLQESQSAARVSSCRGRNATLVQLGLDVVFELFVLSAATPLTDEYAVQYLTVETV